MRLLWSVDFFKLNFLKKIYFRNTDRVSNGLDPDQDLHSVGPDLELGPDLEPNCFAKGYQQTTQVASSIVRVNEGLLRVLS